MYLPPPHPPFHFSTDKSVWQVLGSVGMGAHGWKERVYQPWGRNSYYLGDGFAISENPWTSQEPTSIKRPIVNIL